MGAKAVLAVMDRRLGPRDTALPARGFLVGHTAGAHPDEPGDAVTLQPKDLRKHLYVLGATGCGKTNFLLRLLAHEVKEGRTCVVIDLRGDLVDRLLVRLSALDDVGLPGVKMIDLREDGFVMPFNPLSGSGDLYTRALHLLEVIRKGSESWGVQLEETLRNSLIALSDRGLALTDIERLLEDSGFRQSVIAGCADEHVRSFFERYDRLSAERQQSWALPVLNKVTPLLAIPQLRRMLREPKGFDWEDWLDRPGQLVLIALAAHRFHGASQLLGGLLVSSLQSAVMARASTPEGGRNPVTLFVDEFETMASPSFGAIIAEGRRFGLSLVLTHQNLSQLDPNLRQAIRNNVFVQLFFQTGSLDASDLAGDLVTGESSQTLRQALISQKVGEAFLLRRGEPSVQVATPLSPDPVVDPSRVAQFKLRILESCCIRAAATSADRYLQGSRSDAIPTNQEVRHEKRPRRLH